MLKKTGAMLAGSLVVYVAVSCTSATLDEVAKTQAIEDAVVEALVEIGVVDATDDAERDAVAEALEDVIDALRDSLDDAAPPDAKADPMPVSGTRMRVRYLVTRSTDGALRKAFTGWYDNVRKEKCTPLRAGDGKTRCLPDGAIALQPQSVSGFTPVPLYANALCTTVLAEGAPTMIAKYFVLGADTRVFQSGAIVSPRPARLYAVTSTGCTDVGPTDSTKTYYSATEVVATEFAEMTITEETE